MALDVRNVRPGTVAGMFTKAMASKIFLVDHAKEEAFVSQKRYFSTTMGGWDHVVTCLIIFSHICSIREL